MTLPNGNGSENDNANHREPRSISKSAFWIADERFVFLALLVFSGPPRRFQFGWIFMTSNGPVKCAILAIEVKDMTCGVFL